MGRVHGCRTRDVRRGAESAQGPESVGARRRRGPSRSRPLPDLHSSATIGGGAGRRTSGLGCVHPGWTGSGRRAYGRRGTGRFGRLGVSASWHGRSDYPADTEPASGHASDGVEVGTIGQDEEEPRLRSSTSYPPARRGAPPHPFRPKPADPRTPFHVKRLGEVPTHEPFPQVVHRQRPLWRVAPWCCWMGSFVP